MKKLFFVLLIMLAMLLFSGFTSSRAYNSNRFATDININANSVFVSSDNEQEQMFDNSKMNLVSPNLDRPYNKTRIRLDVELNETCDLGYVDYNFDMFDIYEEFFWQEENFSLPLNEKYKLLCRDCDRYNKTKIFKDSFHVINVQCLNKPEINSTAFFIVDSKPPKISSTHPRRNEFTNGSNFLVKYTEEQPIAFALNASSLFSIKFGPIPFIDIFIEENQTCPRGINQECNFNVNLSEYDDQEIEYSFLMIDFGLNEETSRPTTIKVDTTPPQILNLDYPINRRSVYFNITVNETNFDSLNYIDNSDSRPTWRDLCSRLNRNNECITRKTFREGQHNLTIRVQDKAGNSDEGNIEFVV